MQLTLEVPNSLVKKLRALHLLLPEDNSDSFESIIVDLLDAAAKDAIAEIISSQDSSNHDSEEDTNEQKPNKGGDRYETVSGLGDEDTEDDIEDDYDDEDKGLNDYEGFVPEKGGLTEEDLERDMQVLDPESEAVFDGSGSVDEYDSEPEDLFSSKMNIPTQRVRDPRIQRRIDHQKKLERSRKATVTSLTGAV